MIPDQEDNGIELKVMRGDTYRSSVDQAINEEISAENSMLSIENVNSIIGIISSLPLPIFLKLIIICF